VGKRQPAPEELLTGPEVSTGLCSDSIMYKLHDHSHRQDGKKWPVFELHGRQIRHAILTMEKAYSKAK